MNPEIVPLLTQLDQSLNQLTTNTAVTADKTRPLIDMRASIDKRIADYKAQTESREREFSNTIKSLITSLQQRILDIVKTATEKR
jgi:flagellar capping protein FliD